MTDPVRLVWDEKRPGARPHDCPDLHAEERYGSGEGRLIQGDNLQAMAALSRDLAGQFALIYLDPPFFTGAEWRARVRAQSESAGEEQDGDGAGAEDGLQHDGAPSAQPVESFVTAFADQWDDLGEYLQWMLDRLTLAHELLSQEGCLYVHLNWQAVHYVKLLLDEVFGRERFQNEIVWCYREAINARRRWNRKHDTLLLYSKGQRFTFNCDAVRQPYVEGHLRKYRMRDEHGPYRLMGRGIQGSPLRSRRDLAPEAEAQFPDLTYRHYLGAGTLPVDYWLIDIENQASLARTGYPTQKPEALMERILLASTDPGDLVGDFCCGSGTSLAVAARLGRRWIGCDQGDMAIHTCRKRLLSGGTGFTVERLCRDESGESGKPGEAEILTEAGGESIRVRLSPETAAQVDLWAVDASGHDALFQPSWWSMRTRGAPRLEAVSDPFAAGAGPDAIRVRLYDDRGIRLYPKGPSGSIGDAKEKVSDCP